MSIGKFQTQGLTLSNHSLYSFVLQLWELRNEAECTTDLEDLKTILLLVAELFDEYGIALSATSTSRFTMTAYTTLLKEIPRQTTLDRYFGSAIMVLVNQIMQVCDSRLVTVAGSKRCLEAFNDKCSMLEHSLIRVSCKTSTATKVHARCAIEFTNSVTGEKIETVRMRRVGVPLRMLSALESVGYRAPSVGLIGRTRSLGSGIPVRNRAATATSAMVHRSDVQFSPPSMSSSSSSLPALAPARLPLSAFQTPENNVSGSKTNDLVPWNAYDADPFATPIPTTAGSDSAHNDVFRLHELDFGHASNPAAQHGLFGSFGICSMGLSGNGSEDGAGPRDGDHRSFDNDLEAMDESMQVRRQKHPAIAKPQAKARTKFTDEAHIVLRDWLKNNQAHPYPTEETKRILCEQTGMTKNQLNNWFINGRRRGYHSKLYDAKAHKKL
eukprot:jgi/Hompol1/6854/HPOL_000364-RA